MLVERLQVFRGHDPKWFFILFIYLLASFYVCAPADNCYFSWIGHFGFVFFTVGFLVEKDFFLNWLCTFSVGNGCVRFFGYTATAAAWKGAVSRSCWLVCVQLMYISCRFFFCLVSPISTEATNNSVTRVHYPTTTAILARFIVQREI